MAIDFSSMLRGQRAARQDIRADRLDQRQEEEFAFRRQQRQQQAEQQSWDQQAAGYTSTLLTNMQRAADAGQNDLDFLISQRDAVLQDPAFASFTPEVQERVLKRLGEAAQITAQQHLDAGDPAAARRLYSSFGWGQQIPEQDIAFKTGDSNQIIAAIDPDNTRLRANADGTFTYLPTGQVMRADRLAAVVQQGGGAQALPLLSATLYQEDQAAKAALAQQSQATQMQVMLYDNQMMTQGFIKQPDGSYLNPTTQARMPALVVPGAVPAAGGTAPGGAAPPAAGASSPAPVVAGPVPPPAPLPNVTPPAWQAQLATVFNDLQQQTGVVADLTAQKQRIESRLNVIAPNRARIGRGSTAGRTGGLASGAYDTSVYLPPEARELEQALAAVQAQLDQATIADKTTRQQVIPQLEQQLAADVTRHGTSAPWAPQLIEHAVTAGATIDAARAAVQLSPAVVTSQLQLLNERINELRAQAGQEKEVVRLITARDTLMEALAGRRR